MSAYLYNYRPGLDRTEVGIGAVLYVQVKS